MDIIARHISKSQIKAKIYTDIEEVCAFSGKSISEGVLLEDCISDVFTDYEYIKFHSKYVSIDYAKVILDTIPGKDGKRNNSLRSYSYYASENELRFLKREEILELLLDIPNAPFHICVSYNFKKHTSFKSITNYSKDVFTITTDLCDVLFEKKKVLAFLPIIQEWYSIIPEKADTSAKPTWFTKEEILSGDVPYKKSGPYGLDKFFKQDKFLEKYRRTLIFKLVVHLLNKSYYVES